MMIPTGTCAWCGKPGEVELTEDQAARYAKPTGYIQDRLGDVPAEVREQLISGTHPACFEAMFPPDDEEEF